MSDNTTTLDSAVQALADEAAIRALCDRFADAANHKDYDAFRAIWAEEGIWDIGEPMNVRAEGADAIVSAITKLLDSWEFFVQMPHAGAIRVQGERATARWTMNEVGRTLGDNSQSQYNLSTYADELVKRNGKWLFTKRVYRVTYLDTTPLPGKVLA